MAIQMVLTIFGVVLTSIYLFIKWKQQYWKRQGFAQFKPHLLFGDHKDMVMEHASITDSYTKKYREAKRQNLNCVGLYWGVMPELLLIDSELIKRIMTKDSAYFESHGSFHHESNLLSENTFNLNGEKWKDRRTKLTPLFTSGKMKSIFFGIMTGKGQQFNEQLLKYANSHKSLNIKDMSRRYTTDVIASSAFGLEIDTLTVGTHKFRELGEVAFKPRLLNFIAEQMFPANLLGRLGYQSLPLKLVEYFSGIIKEAVSYREKTGYERADLVQLMLNLKKYGNASKNDTKTPLYMTDDEISAEAFLIYAAGFETSSSTITFALYYLCQDQEIQDRLRNEIRDIIQKHDNQMTYDAVMDMQFLDQVVKETLRLEPVVPIIPRACTKNYTIPGTKLVITKGTKVQIPGAGVHRDSDYYENPDKFDPDRFCPANRSLTETLPYIPFGDGPRLCLGMRFGLLQTKIALISVIKDFRVRPDESLKLPFNYAAGVIIQQFSEDLLIKLEKV